MCVVCVAWVAWGWWWCECGWEIFAERGRRKGRRRALGPRQQRRRLAAAPFPNHPLNPAPKSTLSHSLDQPQWPEFAPQLLALGFERGWGCDAGRARSSMRLLLEILQAPDADSLERFLGSLPLITDGA